MSKCPDRRKYPEQFRKYAVELVLASDRPLRQVARELGVNHKTLRNWVNAAKKEAAYGRHLAAMS